MSCCTAARVDFCASRNGTFGRTIRIKANGSVVDITGWTVRMQVKVEASDDASLLDLTAIESPNNSFIMVSDGTAGEITLFISNDDIQTLPEADDPNDVAVYVYDIVLTNLAGDPNPYIGGTFSVEEGVTR